MKKRSGNRSVVTGLVELGGWGEGRCRWRFLEEEVGTVVKSSQEMGGGQSLVFQKKCRRHEAVCKKILARERCGTWKEEQRGKT